MTYWIEAAELPDLLLSHYHYSNEKDLENLDELGTIGGLCSQLH